MRQSATPRERTEDLERTSLSTWGTLALETKGRDRHEEPDPLRTAFQLDRDRILQSEYFRRLRDKSRLLLAPNAERYPVRLAHTLEIARTARLIARALRLNEDLAEAIALGHDVGHTPFGPAGEQALTECLGRFRHSQHSVRVVEYLEGGGAGLNLTWEVRDGILQHTPDGSPPATVEGHVARVAGRLTWLSRDLDDALRTSVISRADVPAEVTATLGFTHEERIARLVQHVVDASVDRPDIVLPARVQGACEALAEFIAVRVRLAPGVVAEGNRAVYCMCSLAVLFGENPEALPTQYRDDPAGIRDYLAGMTDSDVLREFRRHFMPGVTGR